MENFENSKKAYYQMLHQYPEYLLSLTNSLKGRRKEALLNPQSELELKYAEALFQETIDLNDLKANNKSLEPISIESSNFINKILIKIIKALDKRNHKVIDKYLTMIKNMNAKDAAEMTYVRLVITSDRSPQVLSYFEYIANMCGIDTSGLYGLIKFKRYLNHALNLCTENDHKARNWESDSDESLNAHIDYIREFHSLCVSGKQSNHKHALKREI